MNKNKWKKFWENTKDKLQYLRMDEDDDLDDPLEVEERSLSFGGASRIDLPEGNLREKLEKNRRRKFIVRGMILLLAVLVIGGFTLYNKLYTFTDYTIIESIENHVSSGTRYESVGKNIYRYNSDGVSCVSRDNEVKWSITYNMQGPIVDVCGSTMVIAEQQGTQVYVVNEDGLVGNFETYQPIMKVRVSQQGVVAAVLEESSAVTWVNLYKADGTVLADARTTVEESGYPLDVDISPNGNKVAVSYLGIQQGIMTSYITFYDFGEDENTQSNYITNSEAMAEVVVPEIYFTDNSTAVAVSDDGFSVFRGNSLSLKEQVHFDEEIAGTFHDDERIGFLFSSSDQEYKYRLEMYNYRGKRKASRGINADFDKIKIQNDQILMYSDRACYIFTLSGRNRFSSAYENEIEDIFYFSEFRKYLVVTDDSFDRIRIS